MLNVELHVPMSSTLGVFFAMLNGILAELKELNKE